jgi:hypothetical protein
MPPTPTHTSRAGDSPNRYLVTQADYSDRAPWKVAVTLDSIGPFDSQELRDLMNGKPVQIVPVPYELAADLSPDDLPGQLDDRAAERVGKSYSPIDAALMSDAAYTIRHLADLLDGVMADDPAAIRDAAAWLAANRPEVDW